MIAGPDQSLPARIKFRSKFTWYTLVYYGVPLLSKEKQLVCLFQYIAGLFKNILHLKPVKILLKKNL